MNVDRPADHFLPDEVWPCEITSQEVYEAMVSEIEEAKAGGDRDSIARAHGWLFDSAHAEDRLPPCPGCGIGWFDLKSPTSKFDTRFSQLYCSRPCRKLLAAWARKRNKPKDYIESTLEPAFRRALGWEGPDLDATAQQAADEHLLSLDSPPEYRAAVKRAIEYRVCSTDSRNRFLENRRLIDEELDVEVSGR